MRAILFLIILAIAALIAAIATGLIDINQTQPAQAPTISTAGDGVTAQGGQAPAFDVETGSVKVSTEDKTVKIPTVAVERAGDNEATANAN